MINKTTSFIIILTLYSSLLAAGTNLFSLLKDNATLYTFINVNNINKEESFSWQDKSPIYSGELNELQKNYQVIKKTLDNDGYKNSLEYIFLALKTKTSKSIFTVKKDHELAFLLKLNRRITYNELEKLLNLLLKSNSCTKYSIENTKKLKKSGNILLIKTPKGEEFAVSLLDDNKLIAGGNKNFVNLLHDAKIQKNQVSEIEKNNDVVIDYILPEDVKKELQIYAAGLKNDKNALPLDLSFTKDLKFIRTLINFPNEISVNTTLFLKNSKSLTKAKELSDQLLPLLKFQLLTLSKSKKLTIVDTIKEKADYNSLTMNIRFKISKDDIKEFSIITKKQKETK